MICNIVKQNMGMEPSAFPTPKHVALRRIHHRPDRLERAAGQQAAAERRLSLSPGVAPYPAGARLAQVAGCVEAPADVVGEAHWRLHAAIRTNRRRSGTQRIGREPK